MTRGRCALGIECRQLQVCEIDRDQFPASDRTAVIATVAIRES